MRTVLMAATVCVLTAAPVLAQTERGYVTGVGGFAATPTKDGRSSCTARSVPATSL